MNDIISSFVYPNFISAAGAVCQRWCEQHSYSDRFYQNASWWATEGSALVHFLLTA